MDQSNLSGKNKKEPHNPEKHKEPLFAKKAVDAKGKVTLKLIQNAGFYPMIDTPDTMLEILSDWYSDLATHETSNSDL